MVSPRTSLCALTLLTCAGLAQAERPGRAPRIDQIRLVSTGAVTSRVPLGGVVQLTGARFHHPTRPLDPDDFSHVAVSLSGAACIVLDAAPDQITFLVPQFDVKRGERRLEVTVAGRGRATVRLQVVDPGEVPGQLSDEPTGPCDPGASLALGGRIVRWAVEQTPTGTYLHAEGAAELLAEGLWLQLRVSRHLDGDLLPLDARKVKVIAEDDRRLWRVTFGPYEDLPEGVYRLDAVFELAKQSRIRRRRFCRDLTPTQREALERVHRRDDVEVGAPAQDHQLGR
jgi:hypothetical protein